MSLDITSGDPVIYGATNTGGYEETPTLRYESTDKSGVRTVTAVLSRTIRCLQVNAEAIKQSAAFPGQIIEVNGTRYGAGWTVRSVNIVPAPGGMASVQIEAEREGVTPFEWELPPQLSVECENGVARIYYTKKDTTKVEMLRFDSQTGEDRYGWRVDYVPKGTKRFAVLHDGWYTVKLFDVEVYYENRRQLYLPFVGERFASPTNYVREVFRTTRYEASADAAISAVVALLESKMKTNVSVNQMDAYGTTKYIVGVESENASAYTVTNNVFNTSSHNVSVPVIYAVYDVADLISYQNRGIHWESVQDTDSGSPTFQHIFYQLRYGLTVLLSIDITAAEGAQ